MAGSVYTFVANLSRSRNDGEIRTSQGVIELGQSGLFLPAELASALAEGLQLIAGPATSPLLQLTAPSVVAGSSGALTGVYRYRVTFVTAAGETTSGPESSVTLTAQQASLSNLPLGSATSGVTARKIYRTAANGASGSEKLAATISDNTTTTATDNLVDGSLGVVLPTSDTSAVLSSGSSVAVQTLYAQLTGNPADDAFLISSGTGQKLAQLVTTANSSFAQMRTIISPLVSQSFYLTDRLLGGYFYYDPTDTTTADDGAMVIVTTGGARLKRVVSGLARPEWFGAKGDWVDTSATLGTGTDDTAAFQAAANWVLANDGKGLALTSKYRIDGTVYVNPSNTLTAAQMPNFTIQGTDGHPAASRGRGTAIVRTVTGDCFRVNLDVSGNSTLDTVTDIWQGFSAQKFSFIGKSGIQGTGVEGATITGRVGIRMFRCRSANEHIFTSRFDYAICQPLTDASANQNYCDMSTYRDFRFYSPTLSGLMLTYPDGSSVDGLYFESVAGQNPPHMLEMNFGSGMQIRNVVHHTDPSTYTPAVGSSLIFLNQCTAVTLDGLHLERVLEMKAAIDAFGCNEVTIQSVATFFEGNTFLLHRNSVGVKVSGWNSNETRQGGFFDIDVQGGATTNTDLAWERCYFQTASNSGTARDITVNNFSGRTAFVAEGLFKSLARTSLLATGQGLIAQNFERGTSTQAFAMSTGTARYSALPLFAGDVVTNVCVRVDTGAAGSTLLKVALFDSAGNQLGVSANTTAIGNAPGDHAVPLGTPYTVPKDGVYYAALLIVGTSSIGVLAGRTLSSGAYAAYGSGLPPAGSQTSLADIPSPATITASGTPIWLGVN